MTSPSGRPGRIDPDDLARRVADRLAIQGTTEPGVANRFKFLGTSAVAGLFIVAIAGVLIFAVVSGIGWLADAATPDDQVAQEPEGTGLGLDLLETTTTPPASAVAADPTTTTTMPTTTTTPPSTTTTTESTTTTTVPETTTTSEATTTSTSVPAEP